MNLWAKQASPHCCKPFQSVKEVHVNSKFRLLSGKKKSHYILPGVFDLDLPVTIGKFSILGFISVLAYSGIHFRSQGAILSHLLRHVVINMPPLLISRITGELLSFWRIPVAIIVFITHPRLQTEVMYCIYIVGYLMFMIMNRVEELELIYLARKAVPPGEHFVEKALITPII